MQNTTQYLTVAEVVAHLRERGVSISEETVRRWAKSGRVRAKRLLPGRQYRFAIEDVDALIVEAAA